MLIKVKVFPNSKKEEIIKKSKDAFDLKIKEKPRGGLANKEAARTLSYYFKIPEKNIRLIKGFRQRNKIFEITKT